MAECRSRTPDPEEMNTETDRICNVAHEEVRLPGLRIALRRPKDSESLLDENAFEHEEYLPYWAELWPSARALAAVLAGRDLGGVRVLELGCGLGLPAITAALRGAPVLATDWSHDALRFAAANAALNGAPVETALCRWDEAGEIVARGPWPLVLAADVLYEQRNVDQLLPLLPRLVAPAGEVLVTDPGRRPGRAVPARGGGRVGGGDAADR